MKYCVISPYSRSLRNGQLNPKNYPHWSEVVNYMHSKDIAVKQIGTKGEALIDGVMSKEGDEFIIGTSFSELEYIVRGAQKWLSVDNFFHHFCNSINVPGIVIFGQSDPKIFGHLQNINLLKDRKYLRPDQFGIWESATFNPEAFVDVATVCKCLGF